MWTGLTSRNALGGRRITVMSIDELETAAFFQIRRLDGGSVVRSVSLGDADLPFELGPADHPRFWNLVLPSGVAGRAIVVVFSPEAAAPEGRAGRFLIVAAMDRRDLDQSVGSVALLLTGCGTVLLVAIFLVVPRVVRREFAPIEALAEEATGITAESLGTRFATERLPGELAPIALRLNDLLARLETSFERERRFGADLAHELRTPLAELRSLAELAVKWPDSRPADADRDMLAIGAQMEGIVTRLLALMRSERGQIQITNEHVVIDLMLRHVWQPLEREAGGKGVRVTWSVPEGVSIWTDPILLKSILANLLQNAVDYTPTTGEIAFAASVDANRFEVRVRNSVEGLSAADVSRMFDRFWRRDSARSGTDHAGLGLSLARAFARALGGDLNASLDAEGRLTLTLSGAATPATPPQ